MKNQNTERQKLSFTKKWVEITDLCKPLPNKIMTTHE